MRQIDEIRKLTGGRYLVMLEEDIRFPLYAKELDSFQLQENGQIRDSDLEKIMEEILPKRAKMCAMHYLQSMDRTEYQLRKKLSSLFYPEEIVQAAVDYVKQYHYIDDLRYAVNYMEYRKENKSLRCMEQELYQKGIPQEVVRQASEQVSMPDEEKQIRQWLVKRHYSGPRAERSEKERMYRFLAGKGYSLSSIQRVLCCEDPYDL